MEPDITIISDLDTAEPGHTAYLSMSIKSIDDSAGKDDPGRFFSGMLNAATVDREYETFDPMGVDLSAFKAAGGPIYAGSHFSEVLPNGHSALVARTLSVSRSDKGVYINKAEFDRDELSEHYKGKVQRKFIRCLSAGFLVKDVEYRKPRREGDRPVRVVTKSELFHGILTGQPVNRESLIVAKSMTRVRELEDRLKALTDAPERLADLLAEARQIIERLDALAAKSVPAKTDDASPDLEQASQSMAEMLELAFLAAHPLPAPAFVAEEGYETSKDAALLHLPHHDPAVTDPGEHSTVNKALLRNALARVSRIQPVREKAETFNPKARRHLLAHAAALGIDAKE